MVKRNTKLSSICSKNILKKLSACIIATSMVMSGMPVNIGFNEKFEMEKVYASETLTYTEGNSTYYCVINEDNTIRITSYDGTDTKIIIPEEIEGKKVTEIGSSAFVDKDNLQEVILPEGIVSIGSCSFEYCTNLQKIYIPDGVTSIGKYAFNWCCNLENIILPNSLSILDEAVFADCEKLTKITIPRQITDIADNALSRCTNLSEINVDEDNKNYKSIDGVLFDKDMKTLLRYPSGKEDKLYNIPEGITTIGKYSFRNVIKIEQVNIPDSVVNIEDSAFCESGITEIAVPEGVTAIERNTFFECDNLEKVVLPSTVVSIGDAAFCQSDKLSDINIPDNVTELGWNVFSGCKGLKRINLPKGLKELDLCIFFRSGIEELYIPESISNIHQSFNNTELFCLENIYVSEDNLYYKSEDGVLYSKDGKELVKYPEGRIDSAYTIIEGTEKVGSDAFYGCRYLEILNIVEGITEIGNIRDCINLLQVNFPSTLKKFNIIEDCEKLEKLCLPEGFSEFLWIGDCKNLVEIDFPRDYSNRILISGCSNIKEINIENANELIIRDCEMLEKLIIKNEYSNLKKMEIYGCCNLEELCIPEGVWYIKGFKDCSSLKEINIPSTVTKLDMFSIEGCKRLEKITVDENNSYYMSVDDVLYTKDGTKLLIYPAKKKDKEYSILDTTTEIDIYSFNYSVNLESINLSEGLLKIGKGAFDYSGIKEITITKNVEDIGYSGMFYGCSELENIYVEEGNKWFTSINGVLYKGNDKTPLLCLVKYPEGKKDLKYTMPTYAEGEVCTTQAYDTSVVNNPYLEELVLDGCFGANVDLGGGCTNLKKYVISGEEYNTKVIDDVLYTKYYSSSNWIPSYPLAKQDEVYYLPKNTYGLDITNFSDCKYLKELWIDDLSLDFYTYNLDENEQINLTVYGRKDSKAEKTCSESNIKFVAFDELISEDDFVIQYTEDTFGLSLEEAKNNINLNSNIITEEDEEYTTILDKVVDKNIKENEFNFIVYDTSLEDNNGKKIECSDEAMIKIPVPSDYSGKNIKIYKLSENGSVIDMKAKYIEDYMVFKDKNLGTYIVTETELEIKNIISGDTNGDGEIDIKDSALIKRYLVGADVELDLASADVNGDGEVTIKDSALIKRKLAGWE